MPGSIQASAVIAALDLRPLPAEGGWFRQTWRTASGSAILYLMTPEQFSALHRLPSDEVWHFHAGDPVEHVQLDPRDGRARVRRLGADVLAGDAPQIVVPAGNWQGARIAVAPASSRQPAGRQDVGATAHGWSLVGCTLAPPWDERGFELGVRDALQRAFPAHAETIRALTR